MRVMGLDIGERIIGIAVSDELGITAQGVERILRTNLRDDLKRLKLVADRLEVSEVVVGLPRRTDGRIGPEAEAIIEFAPVLANALDMPVRTWDERYTTVMANQSLRLMNVPKRKRRGMVDEVAAALILQGYLESRGANDRSSV